MNDVKKQAESLTEFVNDFVKHKLLPLLADKNLPLDDRWTLFEATEHFLPVAPFYNEELLWEDEYNAFGTERYRTIYFKNRYEILLDYLDNHSPAEHEEYIEYNGTPDEWRERVLASGYRGCVYDW